MVFYQSFCEKLKEGFVFTQIKKEKCRGLVRRRGKPKSSCFFLFNLRKNKENQRVFSANICVKKIPRFRGTS